MSPSTAKTEFMAELAYEDPRGALDWLARVFGFQTRMVVSDAAGRLVFATTGLDGQEVAVVPEQAERLRSPRTLAGLNSQLVHVTLDEDIAAHYQRAAALGARMLTDPQAFFFGRTYTVADLEDHLWTFRQHSDERRPLPEGWSVDFPNGR